MWSKSLASLADPSHLPVLASFPGSHAWVPGNEFAPTVDCFQYANTKEKDLVDLAVCSDVMKSQVQTYFMEGGVQRTGGWRSHSLGPRPKFNPGTDHFQYCAFSHAIYAPDEVWGRD